MPPISMIGSSTSEVEVPGTMNQVANAPNAPIMKISPWAKLMSWMMP